MDKQTDHKFEILDCTLRDGGYLNNWQFDKKLAQELYRHLSRAGIDFIELGFRNFQEKDAGIWCSTPEELLFELFEHNTGSKIALLIDVGKADLKNIPPSKNSLVKLYRVATHKDNLDEALTIVDKIKNQGYLLSLNLMGIDGYSQDDLLKVAQRVKHSPLDYVYFADSYGSLFPMQIKGIIDHLRESGKKIGFHSHNNLQLAFANTLEAIHAGIDIVDGTVFGMGRGAGNLPIEVLVSYLEKAAKGKKYNPIPILDLIDRYFNQLHTEFKWGYNLPYMLSGLTRVHPNYATHLMETSEYKVEDMVKALEVIKDLNIAGFKRSELERIIECGFVRPKADGRQQSPSEVELKQFGVEHAVTYADRHTDKDFLILANGPSLKDNKSAIDEFIDQYQPVVIGANYLGGEFIPDYHCFSNKKRFIKYIDSVNAGSRILLSSSFEQMFIDEYFKGEFEYLVHLNGVSDHFDIQNGVINSTCRTVSLLSIAVATVMGAKRIFVVGLDGYKNKDIFLEHKTHFYKEQEEAFDLKILMEKHNQNELMLQKINAHLLAHQKEDLYILTPTTYKFFYNDIHNWLKAKKD